MKKPVLVLVLAAAAAGVVWSQGITLSAGALLDPSFGATADSTGAYFGFGVDAFFDATYVMASVGFDGVTVSAKNDPYSYLSLGLLGKYPMALGEKFAIAPALGFEYQLLDNFILKFGTIADYTITGNLYARAGFIAAFGLAHKAGGSTFGADVNIGVGYSF
jgi:hypothetical protein